MDEIIWKHGKIEKRKILPIAECYDSEKIHFSNV